jgi:hypothetical protein
MDGQRGVEGNKVSSAEQRSGSLNRMSAQNSSIGAGEMVHDLVEYRRRVIWQLILFCHEEEFLSNLLLASRRDKSEAAES